MQQIEQLDLSAASIAAPADISAADIAFRAETALTRYQLSLFPSRPAPSRRSPGRPEI